MTAICGTRTMIGMSTFGKRLRDAREARGLTQLQLADLCGWEARSRVSMYEKDRRTPSLEEIETLAKLLDVPPGELAFGERQSAEKLPTTKGGLTLRLSAAKSPSRAEMTELLTLYLGDASLAVGAMHTLDLIGGHKLASQSDELLDAAARSLRGLARQDQQLVVDVLKLIQRGTLSAASSPGNTPVSILTSSGSEQDAKQEGAVAARPAVKRGRSKGGRNPA
jgi:transcriptional regulator with XRE-family HTH domain